MAGGNGEKSEQPSQRRLQKARESGQFPVSREFTAGVQFLVAAYAITSFGREWITASSQLMRYAFRFAFRNDLTVTAITSEARSVILTTLAPLLKGAAILVALVLATHLITTQFGFASSKLSPDFSRLNPLQRVQQLRRQNLPAFFQALILLPLFGYIVFLVIRSNLDQLLRLPLGNVQQGIQQLGSSLSALLWKAAICFFLFGCYDLFRQRRRHSQDLKMTKQELREEHKESEGNPQIKQQIRRLQRDAARRNMMKEVPKASAVIVNPTHYAVAVRYVMDSMAAPTVVAKGKNYLALRIRQKAIEHNVPIVENVALAQALYKSADVGQEIPAHLYRAVAEVLAYIYRLMNGRMPGHF